ncbi:cytochrome P450 sterol C22-desaturase [Hysterangium stoloniferum]|nr:cytochrome P450 sterol C22-desaturase [Hysterangium stoloniferum]
MAEHSRPAIVPSYTEMPLSYFTNSTILPTISSSSTWLYTSLAVLAALFILEQTIYRRKKANLPGSSWTIPIIGKFADSMNPTMEGYQRQWDSGALSALSVFNIFIVMASSNEYTRKILNSPTYAEPCLVASAKQVLSPDNWVFLTGKVHVEYRRILNTLFTRKALSLYLSMQDNLARKHFKIWLKECSESDKPITFMIPARDLNMRTSLKVFCGPHIPEEAVKEISDKYWLITRALELVNFPLAIPGTKVYSAIQARKVAMRWLENAARLSKIAMKEGAEPSCLLDKWVMELLNPESKGRKDFSDREMAMVILSFLFASQDAMSSGIIYAFQHFADHPEVLAKVREEQQRVRGGDYNRPMTLDMLDEMPYLRSAIRESLRLKPPVTMVPYKSTKAFPISATYTVPAGSMVIPSLYPSCHDSEIFPEPKKFIPERWLDPAGSAWSNPKNFLVFGSGPHKCIGIEYTLMHMACVLGTASVLMDWEHVRTVESDKVQIIATLFPKDGCVLKFRPRSSA